MIANQIFAEDLIEPIQSLKLDSLFFEVPDSNSDPAEADSRMFRPIFHYFCFNTSSDDI